MQTGNFISVQDHAVDVGKCMISIGEVGLASDSGQYVNFGALERRYYYQGIGLVEDYLEAEAYPVPPYEVCRPYVIYPISKTPPKANMLMLPQNHPQKENVDLA